MPLLIVAIGVILLLILIIYLKLNSFIALILTSLLVGVMEGMPVNRIIASIQAGVGNTLGSMALIIGFGAMLGKLLADCGGAQRIAETLIRYFGHKYIPWAIALTGFVLGFVLFYEVGFVLLLPLVGSIAVSARIPLLYLGIPMIASLSITHGLLPPHPGPTAIATIFHADMNKTLLYGTIIGIPVTIISGPIYAHFVKYIDHPVPKTLYNNKEFTEDEMPSFAISLWTTLIPVILMGLRAVAELTLSKQNGFLPYTEFFGDPVMATFIAVIVAIFTFGVFRHRKMEDISNSLVSSIKMIAMILFVIGGGGAFKEILIDSGVGIYITHITHFMTISPLLMAWAITAILRIALGSSTVASITAGGIVSSLIASTGVNPELMVLAVGSGSLMFSHVNDPGFWLFKEYFNLSIVETFKSWTVLETVISFCGLIGCLLASYII